MEHPIWARVEDAIDEIRHGDAVEIKDDKKTVYFKCPACGNSNITRAFQRCVDCKIKIYWRK